MFTGLSRFSREVVFDKAHSRLAHFYRTANLPIAEALREEDGNGEAFLQHGHFGRSKKRTERFRECFPGP